jgi:hypothetical protein
MPTSGIQALVSGVLDRCEDLSDKAMVAAGVIVSLLAVFHWIRGGLQLAEKQRPDLTKPDFWYRWTFIVLLLVGYKPIFVGQVRGHLTNQMGAALGSWYEGWKAQNRAIDEQRKAESENKMLRDAALGSHFDNGLGGLSSSWMGLLGSLMLDAGAAMLGYFVSALIGFGLWFLIGVQVFWVLGVVGCLLAIGPLCIAFGLHERTEVVFYRFLWEVFVYAMLYLPFYTFTCFIAGVMMSHATSAALGAVAYGDGTDVAVHMVASVFGPLAAFAVTKGAPATLQRVFGGGDGGERGAALMQEAVSRVWGSVKSLGGLVLGVPGAAAGGGGLGALGSAALGKLFKGGAEKSVDPNKARGN